jgi:hypothetical protein
VLLTNYPKQKGKLTTDCPCLLLDDCPDCASSTMEPIPDSCLPYTFIDPSLGLCSVFDAFGIDIESSDVGWNSFTEKPIPQSKLRDLIVCSAFFLDGRNVKVQDSTQSIWRQDFVCTCCTNFHLLFKCSHPTKGDDNLFILLKTLATTHDPTCLPTKIILDGSLIEYHPKFINYLWSKELHPMQSVTASLSLGDIKSFLSTHGYKIRLSHSSIYLAIGHRKAKYLREVADTYCMLSSFL